MMVCERSEIANSFLQRSNDVELCLQKFIYREEQISMALKKFMTNCFQTIRDDDCTSSAFRYLISDLPKNTKRVLRTWKSVQSKSINGGTRNQLGLKTNVLRYVESWFNTFAFDTFNDAVSIRRLTTPLPDTFFIIEVCQPSQIRSPKWRSSKIYFKGWRYVEEDLVQAGQMLQGMFSMAYTCDLVRMLDQIPSVRWV